ncbi:hypothetical protein [Solirubrobacter deserti]|uniref:Uncharacterized protein n=1 Tax=Solirubrobacter deserti TaxID=2282478 RepID=A0ABT4RPV6_9ACTN|nr:hypothetical protein [Solirubrobacter deserti]MDA0140604.1 hypothetical protein [Solirubrobacter deserti]
MVIGEGVAPRRVRRREPRDTVPVTRITIIDAEPLTDDATAGEWLRTADVTPGFTAVLDRLVAAFRVASADPLLADVDVARAWRTRIGYGSGEQVAEGEWTEARELPPLTVSPQERRAEQRRTDRLVALLSARDAILASEELTLRARLDLDRSRAREAAIQLEAALATARAELAAWGSFGDLAQRLVELEGCADIVAAAAAAAREGRLEPETLPALTRALETLEAALRARAIYSAEGREDGV